MRIAISIVVLLLTGCGTTWTHPDKTAGEWQRDYYACQKDSAAQPAAEAIAMRHRCMQLLGWRAQ